MGLFRVYGKWFSLTRLITTNINLLSKCKDVGKQHDGAEVQHGNYSCQGCLLSNLTNVKVFHLMEFKGYTIKDGYFEA